MKAIVVTGLVLAISACASSPTLEELEAEALRTGDWSAVEAREAVIAKRNARRPQQCAVGLVSVCQRNLGQYECQCVTNSDMAQVLVR